MPTSMHSTESVSFKDLGRRGAGKRLEEEAKDKKGSKVKLFVKTMTRQRKRTQQGPNPL